MKLTLLLLGIGMGAALATTVALEKANGQAIDVKSWNGEYPDMEKEYPLCFFAFKDGSLANPHFFVRTWPTHYYFDTRSSIVEDGGEYHGKFRTGIPRLVIKGLERDLMKGRYSEKEQTKDKTGLRHIIAQTRFDARSDQIADIYGLALGFVRLYAKTGQLNELENAGPVYRTFQKEANGLLSRFVLVNLMGSDHGQKLKAFAGIRAELDRLAGETDYTYRKILHLNAMGNNMNASYAFLSQ